MTAKVKRPMNLKMSDQQFPDIEERVALSDREFALFQQLIFEVAGITMSSEKKALVLGRLGKRVRRLQLPDFETYYRYLTQGEGRTNGEWQCCIDLLTTHETYFFREPQHFEFLSKEVLPQYSKGQRVRVWSAASSSGEEIYTLAMVLADTLGLKADWSVLGTDISKQMVEACQDAIYPESRVRQTTKHYRHRYLLRGVGQYQGMLSIVPELRQKVRFQQFNLLDKLTNAELFDIVFCRNVLIYFDMDTKRKVVKNLCDKLKVGGYLITGHSESLQSMLGDGLDAVKPSIYRKRARL